jgi:hypothetical protein
VGKLVAFALLVLALLIYVSRAGAQLEGDTTAPNDEGDAPDGAVPFPNPEDSNVGQSDALDNILQGIFQMEGGKPGDRNVVNNNPGNLRAGPGMIGTAGGIATFADIGDGWGDVSDYVTKHVQANPNWNFYDFFEHYLGGKPGSSVNNTQGNSGAYADYVANYAGFDPSQTMYSAIYGG